MKKVFIIYNSFFTRNGENITIGGIQTYIKMLINLIRNKNLEPIIIQSADNEFINNYNGAKVIGVPMKKKLNMKKQAHILYNSIQKTYDKNKDIIIFATHSMNVNNKDEKIIGIHHGITSDIPRYTNRGKIVNYFFGMLRSLKAYKTIKDLNNFNKIVAVDHNVVNWYRTRLAYEEVPITVIPNSTIVKSFDKEEDSTINILFARRLFHYRGTRLFADAIENILKKHKNIKVTIAGEGPDEQYLINQFKNNSNVNFIKYKSEDSIDIHKKHQIAVIPTLGSEGTSLSLLEAMAAKCAVIATNVGGMTNVVIDYFNGRLINPKQKELELAIEELITNATLRKKLSSNAFLTVEESFNHDLWEKKWSEVLDTI